MRVPLKLVIGGVRAVSAHAAGLGAFTFVYAKGKLVPHQRSRGLRQLPRDDRSSTRAG
jgi:hypothetical protein